MATKEREKRKRAHHRAEIRQTRREKFGKRKRIKRYIIGGITGSFALMIILSLILPSSLGNPNSASTTSYAEGNQVNIQDPVLVGKNEAHPEYNSAPPTSGWYQDISDESIVWGALTEEIEPEKQVAHLRNGTILIQYNCILLDTIKECEALRENLRLVSNRYQQGVIQSPNMSLQTVIALSSWGWLDTFNEYDELRIEDFLQIHIDKGPASFKQ
jgi:hypothetical protein